MWKGRKGREGTHERDRGKIKKEGIINRREK